jgi:hypothetical protein
VDTPWRRSLGATTVQHLLDHLALRLGLHRRVAGDEVVEHRGQGIHVGLGAQGRAIDLLGRHVGQRTHTVHLGGVGLQVQHAAEVGELHVGDLPRAGHGQDVGRLDVAVDQPLAEDVAQGHRALEADLDDELQRQQLVGPAKGPQRRALHVFHHQVGLVGAFHGVEELHHVRMVQPAHERRFGGEEARVVAPVHRVAQGRGAHALDGHVAFMEAIAAEEDFAGGAFAQLAHDLVFADVGGRGRGRAGRRFGGGCLGVHRQRIISPRRSPCKPVSPQVYRGVTNPKRRIPG